MDFLEIIFGYLQIIYVYVQIIYGDVMQILCRFQSQISWSSWHVGDDKPWPWSKKYFEYLRILRRIEWIL